MRAGKLFEPGSFSSKPHRPHPSPCIAMSPPSLRATFVVLVVSAVAAFATPSLTVKASTPNVNVDGLEKLKVTTIVTNTGDETLKLLNDPRGVLDSFPENSFHITDAAGSRPSFNGGKVNSRVCLLRKPVCSCPRVPLLGQVQSYIRCRP